MKQYLMALTVLVACSIGFGALMASCSNTQADVQATYLAIHGSH